MLGGGGEADEMLRRVVAILHQRLRGETIWVSFVEGDELVRGPVAGAEAETMT